MEFIHPYLCLFFQGAQKPYKNVIKANIGDAHAMGIFAFVYFLDIIPFCL